MSRRSNPASRSTLGRDTYGDWRAARIRDLLAEEPRQSVAELRRDADGCQVSDYARRLLPVLNAPGRAAAPIRRRRPPPCCTAGTGGWRGTCRSRSFSTRGSRFRPGCAEGEWCRPRDRARARRIPSSSPCCSPPLRPGRRVAQTRSGCGARVIAVRCCLQALDRRGRTHPLLRRARLTTGAGGAPITRCSPTPCSAGCPSSVPGPADRSRCGGDEDTIERRGPRLASRQSGIHRRARAGIARRLRHVESGPQPSSSLRRASRATSSTPMPFDFLQRWRAGSMVQLGPEPNVVSRQIRIMPKSAP